MLGRHVVRLHGSAPVSCHSQDAAARERHAVFDLHIWDIRGSSFISLDNEASILVCAPHVDFAVLCWTDSPGKIPTEERAVAYRFSIWPDALPCVRRTEPGFFYSKSQALDTTS